MISARLLRTAFVLLSLPVIVLLLALAVWITVVATAIAFSGSSSGLMPNAPAGTAPVLSFVAGAVAASWLVALSLAVSTLQRFPTIPVVAAAIVGGVVTALVPSLAKPLLAVVRESLSLLGPFLAYK